MPAEAYLHLPQKQKFNAFWFLEGKSMILQDLAVTIDESGGGRVTLGNSRSVTQG